MGNSSIRSPPKQPTVVFLSEKDCILPIPKLLNYFSQSKFGKIVQGDSPSRLRPYTTPPTSNLSRTSTPALNGSNGTHTTTITKTQKELVKADKSSKGDQTSGGEEGSVRIMSGLEHAAILLRPGWCREVSKAIDQVGKRAEEWEQRERIEMLQ